MNLKGVCILKQSANRDGAEVFYYLGIFELFNLNPSYKECFSGRIWYIDWEIHLSNVTGYAIYRSYYLFLCIGKDENWVKITAELACTERKCAFFFFQF